MSVSMNETPSGERIHIGIFGRRNTGKSSLINALTGQELAIVSPVGGTTTDPVSKAMELPPLGPVVFIDTPGLDDEGELGRQRVKKGLQALEKTDIALLVAEAGRELDPLERDLLNRFRERNLAYLVVVNKVDLAKGAVAAVGDAAVVSAATGYGIPELRERIACLRLEKAPAIPIVSDLLAPGDIVVLVTPIDASAPKGRLILPQQQTIRDILDADATALVTKETGLKPTLASLKTHPRMVITDSQVFGRVARDTPVAIPLTSFSILMARHKGFLERAIRGVKAAETLEEGDPILIAEGCTHHRQCEDIGTAKLPRWLDRFAGRTLRYEFSSGGGFPEDLSPYKLVVHCGGCMLPGRVMGHRVSAAGEQGVPITNYGILIARMNGILARSLEPFPELLSILRG